jgi:hypothetical protein
MRTTDFDPVFTDALRRNGEVTFEPGPGLLICTFDGGMEAGGGERTIGRVGIGVSEGVGVI